MHIERQHRFDAAAAGSVLFDDLGKHLVVHTGRINRRQPVRRFRQFGFVGVTLQIGGNVDVVHGTYGFHHIRGQAFVAAIVGGRWLMDNQLEAAVAMLHQRVSLAFGKDNAVARPLDGRIGCAVNATIEYELIGVTKI